jgi:23S rRNA (adenine2503-C2)-methyltransferase
MPSLIGLNLIGMDLAEMEAMLGALSGSASGAAQPRFRARQIYDAVYRQRVVGLDSISNLPKPLREELHAATALGLPIVERVYDSTDGTRRYLLKLDDGRTVETVWMPVGAPNPRSRKARTGPTRPHELSETRPVSAESGSGVQVNPLEEAGRATVCISTQVGCPVNCGFCLTALMGLERNLTAGEIAGQVLRVAADQGVVANSDRLNVVLMGQGEPLLNLPNVLKATRLLTDPQGVAISPRRITLSTSGIIPKIEELGQAEVRPKLAISLNASSEEQRRELMPITRKYHLKDLIAVCRAYPLRTWEKLTFEYVLLRGVNDTDADARRVVKLLANLDAKVNLIALNPGPGIPYQTPAPERVASFQAIVRRSLPCFLRKPRGLDVYAACGQLKRMELVPIRPV